MAHPTVALRHKERCRRPRDHACYQAKAEVFGRLRRRGAERVERRELHRWIITPPPRFQVAQPTIVYPHHYGAGVVVDLRVEASFVRDWLRFLMVDSEA